MTNSLTSVHLISPQHENHLLEIIASREFLITMPTFFHYVHFTGFLYFLLNISIFWLISARIIQDQMDILFLTAINSDCLSISNNLTMSYFYNFIWLWPSTYNNNLDFAPTAYLTISIWLSNWPPNLRASGELLISACIPISTKSFLFDTILKDYTSHLICLWPSLSIVIMPLHF